MKELIDGYETIRIYGLTIRASSDGRIEIETGKRGTVNRLYVEPTPDGFSVRSHDGTLDETLVCDPILSTAARALRAIPSERRAEQSRENGKKGGRPRKPPIVSP